MIPSLDAHAHLELNLTRVDLDSLGLAGIMAVTRSPEEWPGVLRRKDTNVAWGVGCHPGLIRALRLYDESLFAAVARKATFVGEVGLDGRSANPDLQRRVFRSILRVATGEGLIVSVHSLGRTAEVLDLVEDSGASNVILHWWTGSASETERAVRLGLYFSINGAVRPETLSMLPRERVTTETDFPLTAGIDLGASMPGSVDTAISALARQWRCDASTVRSEAWGALRALDRDRGKLERQAPAFSMAMETTRLP